MSDAEYIKSRLNIVDVVKEYVPELKKTGANWIAKSPFRTEKTPSFVVNEQRGIFKDFGGDKSGDVFEFIMAINNISFTEALEILAKKAGVEIHKGNANYSKIHGKLLEINLLAAKYYNYILNKNNNAAKKYIENRNLINAIDQYLIGFADNSNNLVNVINKKVLLGELNDNLIKSTIKDFEFYSGLPTILQLTGLFVYKNGIWREKYIDRIIFPILNINSEVIGFSARTYKKEDIRPKYLNSPETIVFKKSKNLFNLSHVKELIKFDDYVILTEGQIDCISATIQAKLPVVASLGTAITDDQVILIAKLTKNIYLCFDNDEAGNKACEKAFKLLSTHNIKTYVLKIPESYKDLDEFVNSSIFNKQDFISSKVDYLDHYINQIYAATNIEDNSAKINSLNQIIENINYIQNIFEVDERLKKLSVLFQIEFDLVKKYYENRQKSIGKIEFSEVITEKIINDIPLDPTEIYSKTELKIISMAYNFDDLKDLFYKIPKKFFTIVNEEILNDIDKVEDDDILSNAIAKIDVGNGDNRKHEFVKFVDKLKVDYFRRVKEEMKKNIFLTDELSAEDIANLKNILNIIK